MKSLLTLLLLLNVIVAQPQGIVGTTGLFNIPSAHMQTDGTLMTGLHYLDHTLGGYGNRKFPALIPFASLTFLPFVEVQFRYTFMVGIERGPDISHFGDRMVSARFRLYDGTKSNWPSLAIGFNDMVSLFQLLPGRVSASHFNANYIVVSKVLNVNKLNLDASLGYAYDLAAIIGRTSPKRLYYDGFFGGLEFSHSRFTGSGLMIEFDSRRIHGGIRVLLFNRFQLLAGLNDEAGFSGGITYKVVL